MGEHNRDSKRHPLGSTGLLCLIVLALIDPVWSSHGEDVTPARPPAGDGPVPGRPSRTNVSNPLRTELPPETVHRPSHFVLESDNWTFRPTVIVRRGSSQGSGTIVASVDGETLVITASHVVRGSGPILVELHRYNLGIENRAAAPGKWPRRLRADALAQDSSADVAIIRVRELIALPYVARMGKAPVESLPRGKLTSVGIDLGTKLTSWDTRLVESTWLSLMDNGPDRPFLLTTGIPEHGRSGGGLFDSKGRLIGVCIGHAELIKGRRLGIFSSIENVQELMKSNDLSAVVQRSEARQARLARETPLSSTISRTPYLNRPAIAPSDLTEATSPAP